MNTPKTATKKATKKTKSKSSSSLATLRRDALKHFGVDPFDRDALLAAIGKGTAKPTRANVVHLAKKTVVQVQKSGKPKIVKEVVDLQKAA